MMNLVPFTPPIAVSAFFICTALAGYAAQFGDFTYEEHDTYIEITFYPREATGELTVPGEIVGKPVTSIGELAFSGCTSLTSVTIPNSVTSIGAEAFFLCGLTSVTIPDSVTSIGGGAFLGCTSLTAITVIAANPAYSSVDGVLFDKDQTVLINYPPTKAGPYAIPDSVTSIGDWAFIACTSLTSVTIPERVASIGHVAFRDCRILTAITVDTANSAYSSIDGVLFDKDQTVLIYYPPTKAGPYAIPDSVTSLGDSAFYRCTRLTSVTIPDSVTSIGDGAFIACTSLTSVTIPERVASIAEWAFVGCASLTSVYFEGNAPDENNVFFGVWDGFQTNATVYYLSGTTGWGSTYGGRPTAEISVLPDPLIGGTPVDGLEGRFLSDWWGEYSAAYAPWLLHAEHGWLYRYPGSTNVSLYFYDDAMGAWWWTRSGIYPWIYAFDPPADNRGTDIGSEWLEYDKDTKNPRSFSVTTAMGWARLYFDP